MGVHSPCAPCLPLYLLPLLFPPPVLRALTVQYQGPSWRMFHRLTKGSRSSQGHASPSGRQYWRSLPECQGIFNLYFILDKSGSVDNNWIHVYSFVEELVEKFRNPDLQVSFITYSNDADIVMPLTSDRAEIRKGLIGLQRIVPGGYTLMQKGFKMANEQIERAQRGGKRVASIIIALTDGILLPDVFQETMKEANKARDMGAVIYTVGVLDYSKDQMSQVADSPEHVIGVSHGFRNLHDIVNSLSNRSCMETTSVEPSAVCAGELYKVDITGHGFHNTKGQDQVICRFKFSDSYFVDEKVISMTENSITCPGPMIERPGQEVSITISLSNGAAFLGDQVSINSIRCMRAQIQPIPKKMLLALLPALLLIPLLIWCCWRFCCKKTKKEPPPPPPPEPQEPEEEKEPPSQALVPVNTCPTVIVACCGCGSRTRGIESHVDPCCSYFSPTCHQMPVMWCPPRVQERCSNYTVMNPSCTQACSPKICLRPNRECFHITQPPCRSKIALQPGEQCYQVAKAPGSSRFYLQTSPDCVPISQTVYTPRMCPQSYQRCFSLNSYPKCQPLPTRCTRCPSRMLPLLPPKARQSVDSLYQPSRSKKGHKS